MKSFECTLQKQKKPQVVLNPKVLCVRGLEDDRPASLEIKTDEDKLLAVEGDCACRRVYDSTANIQERVKRLFKQSVGRLGAVEANDERIASVFFLCYFHELDESLTV